MKLSPWFKGSLQHAVGHLIGAVALALLALVASVALATPAGRSEKTEPPAQECVRFELI